MGRRGRPMPDLVLTDDERMTLAQWTRRRTTAQALATRARIVLACAEGVTNSTVADRERVTRPTVGRWRQRFVDGRCTGLLDEPKPGAPRQITNAMLEHALTTTLESMPVDATQWSTRSLAKVCGLSKTAVARIWKAFALQPHRASTFKLSKDLLFIEKVRDIVGLYLNPPPVNCALWSVLKIVGRRVTKARCRASRQNWPSTVTDNSHASTYRLNQSMTATKYTKPWRNRT